jgi:hypothetical protein
VTAVRCPKCGEMAPDGQRRGVRCHACREYLRKCRYCAHYDFDSVDCINIHRREQDHVVDADEVLDCPEFVSLLTSARAGRAWYLPARTYAIAAGLTLAAALGAIHMARGPQVTPSLPISASVSAPDLTMKEDGLDVTVMVFNPSDQPAEGVEVLITGKDISRLTCQSVIPPEAFLEVGPRRAAAAVGELLPGEQRSVTFHFAARRTGEVTLTASVTMAKAAGSIVKTVASEIIP